MQSLFSRPVFLLSAAERFARAERAARRGIFLDSMQHGDVAVLKTRTVEVAFLAGVPAAYFDKATGALFVSTDLKLGALEWHRERIVDIWHRTSWRWCEPDAVFQALTCQRAGCRQRFVKSLDSETAVVNTTPQA